MNSSLPRVGQRAHDLKINFAFLARVIRLCRPYWTRIGAWRSWLTLGVIMVLISLSVSSGVWLSYLSRDATNALVERSAGPFWALLAQQFALASVLAALVIPIEYLARRLQLHWRGWMTDYTANRYLQRRAYYEVNGSDYVDNPDQRIQEEIDPFCEAIVGIPRHLILAFSNMGAQAGILWTVSAPLFNLTLLLSVVQVYITYWLAQPTIKQNFDITNTEANFRFGLLHLREHSESVAFYQGEEREKKTLSDRLRAVVDKTLIKINYSVRVMTFDVSTSVAWEYLPYLLVVPLYFSEKIDFGAIGQAQAASAQIVMSFAIITNFIPLLAQLAPHAVRLSELHETCDDIIRGRRDPSLEIDLKYSEQGVVALESVSLETPGAERKLVQGLSFRLEPGTRLLIVGQTGVGKSSLLRAMAGLWTRGSGRICMPSPQDVLFLPQRPYMLLGSLREQIRYPLGDRSMDDARLQEVLERVDLADLAEEHGGFDAVKDWNKTLSLGEQQRLAFARVLTNRPRHVFLDEATSAVDSATEALLYGVLRRTGATVVSVGHRFSLLQQHTQVLRLMSDGAWRIETPGEAQDFEAALQSSFDSAAERVGVDPA